MVCLTAVTQVIKIFQVCEDRQVIYVIIVLKWETSEEMSLLNPGAFDEVMRYQGIEEAGAPALWKAGHKHVGQTDKSSRVAPGLYRGNNRPR